MQGSRRAAGSGKGDRMPRLTHLLPLILFSAALPGPGQEAGKGATPLQEFQEHVDDYLKIRKMVTDSLPALKTTPSAKELSDRKTLLASTLAQARSGASQGTIFTPEVAAEFRRRCKLAMAGGNGVRVHQSLKNASPVQGTVRVNQVYPSSVPRQSMPPTLLMGLPTLPMQLEYSLVGRTLVLRDYPSSLIVDFLPEAIP
jgi:C-terminal processing protease CtpA/Prc